MPLSGSLYQQQHALARHTAGDAPTEGVRTAPTPSLPPTPCIDTEPSFPPTGLQPSNEDPAADDQIKVDENAEVEAKPVAVTTQTAVSEEKAEETAAVSQGAEYNGAPPDIVSGTRDLSIQEEDDADSTKDLDVVSGGGAPASISPPEMLDTPPEMPDVLDDSPSPDIDLPDAPDSEPSSPKVRIRKTIVIVL